MTVERVKKILGLAADGATKINMEAEELAAICRLALLTMEAPPPSLASVFEVRFEAFGLPVPYTLIVDGVDVPTALARAAPRIGGFVTEITKERPPRYLITEVRLLVDRVTRSEIRRV